jgi:hypothetical protein
MTHRVVDSKLDEPGASPTQIDGKSGGTSEGPRNASARRLLVLELLLVALLLGGFAYTALSAGKRLSLTYDEHTYIPAGYSYWTKRDFRVNREHPPLAKLVAGLPLLGLDLDTRGADAIFATLPTEGTSMGQWDYGEELLFGANLPKLEDVIFRARAAMLLFPLLWLSVIYVWSRQLFGRVGALVSLTVAAFNPDVLGHGVLAANDIPIATFFLTTTYLGWSYLKHPRFGTLALLGLSLGAALSTKFSGLLLLPVLGALSLGALLDPALKHQGSVAARAPLGEGTSFERFATTVGLLFLFTAPFAALVVTGAYLFAEPLGTYADALRLTYTLVADDYQPLLFGEYRTGGFWYYFLAAALFKLPLGLQALLGVAGWQVWSHRARLRDVGSQRRFDLIALALPALLVVIAVSAFAAQIGHRYLFPAYGFLFVAVGAVGRQTVNVVLKGSSRPNTDKFPLTSVLRSLLTQVLVLTVGGTIAVAYRSYPFYISYANALVRSEKQFLGMFDMGVVDWRQGWKEVAALQKQGRLDDVAMYIPERLPRAQTAYGIRYARYRLSKEPPAPGTYVFSSNDYSRARRGNRERGVHVPLLEDYPYDVIAGSVVAVHAPGELPPALPGLTTRLDVKKDDAGRLVWEREVFTNDRGETIAHGKYTTWRPNGTKETGQHWLGEVHGDYVRYHANGKPSETGTMWLGKLHGEATRYDETGKAVGSWRYIDDEKVR